MSTITTDIPRLYVACLASYNAGILHGQWIDCDDVDSVREGIAAVLAASPTPGAEEHAIHHHEGWYGYAVQEHEPVEDLCALAELMDEHGPVAALIHDHEGANLDRTRELLTDGYRGCWESVDDYARELVDDLYDLDRTMGNLARYFDHAAFARDLELSGDVFTLQDPESRRVHVFDGCL